MTVWEAIRKMRELSGKGVPFSFGFMSYDRDRRESQGMVVVRHASLRPQSRKDEVRDADHKLNYTDLDTGDARNCWQVLITEFNGQRLTV